MWLCCWFSYKSAAAACKEFSRDNTTKRHHAYWSDFMWDLMEMCCTEEKLYCWGKKTDIIWNMYTFFSKYKIKQVFFSKFYQMFLSLDLSAAGKQIQSRPQWAAQNLEAFPANKDSIKRLSQTSQWNAGIRPGPVRPPVPILSKEGLRASQRSHRSTPSKPICTFDINLK